MLELGSLPSSARFIMDNKVLILFQRISFNTNYAKFKTTS